MIHQNQMIGKRFEKNNPAIALNILYTNEKEILLAYISKNISTREKQLILSMITNEEKGGCIILQWQNQPHYCTKRLQAIRVISFVWITLILLEQKIGLTPMKKASKIKDFSEVILPSEKAIY